MNVDEIRQRAEEDLYYFARLINPQYVYGDVHEKVFRWMQDGSADNKLLLLPRAHLKSHCVAVYTAWRITKDPSTSIIYLVSGEDLGKGQMYAIKGMLTCDTYQALWPEMINPEEGKREAWSAWAINVDHPKRKEAGTRDNTLLLKTVKSNFTGLHCDEIMYDDVVVPGNAYTEIGRTEVRRAISQSSSVLNPGGRIVAAGTRYHPRDAYHNFKEELIPVFNDEGVIIDEKPAWDIFEFKAEDRGDLTGNFLWPRAKSPKTGKWYGFDTKVLATIRAKYFALGERAQFHAQYYNEPNDPDSARLDHDKFQYYDKKHLKLIDGDWHFLDKKLNVYAAVDFAFTDGTKSDYTAIAVVGRDSDGNIYVLDLDQFRTSRYDEYYKRILEIHRKWELKKIRVESNSGANLIADYIKQKIREEGLRLTLDSKATTARSGAKEQRIAAILEPRYENGDMWHYKAGLTHELEEQLVQERPPHDDLKDALAAAVEISTAPARNANRKKVLNIKTHPRFGGVIR